MIYVNVFLAIAKADELLANGRRLLAWSELDDCIAMPLLLYAQSMEQHHYVFNELGDHIEEETDEGDSRQLISLQLIMIFLKRSNAYCLKCQVSFTPIIFFLLLFTREHVLNRQ